MMAANGEEIVYRLRGSLSTLVRASTDANGAVVWKGSRETEGWR